MGVDKGLIFDIGKSELGYEGFSYAQGPKVLKFDDFTRVYFATRPLPIDGQYLSKIHFADFSPTMDRLLNVSASSVVSPANLGSFDEHGIFPLEVVQWGGHIWGFSGGWTRRVSVSIDMAIGRLVSRDGGTSFVRDGDGPVLASSAREPFLIGDPCVVDSNGLLHMFYIFGTRWTKSQDGTPERTYLIGQRFSRDGLEWKNSTGGGSAIIPRISEWEAQAMPSVVKVRDKWFMFFSFRDTFGFREHGENAYRLGLAVSNDLLEWRRLDVDFEHLRSNWNSEMMCYPNVHVHDGHLYILYNGNKFGRSGFGLAILHEDFVMAVAE